MSPTRPPHVAPNRRNAHRLHCPDNLRRHTTGWKYDDDRKSGQLQPDSNESSFRSLLLDRMPRMRTPARAMPFRVSGALAPKPSFGCEYQFLSWILIRFLIPAQITAFLVPSNSHVALRSPIHFFVQRQATRVPSSEQQPRGPCENQRWITNVSPIHFFV